MLRKIQQYRDAIARCFALGAAPQRMSQALSWLDREYPKNDFSTGVFRSQVHKACANVKSAYKSSAPKILFYSQVGHTYRRATPPEIEEGARLLGSTSFDEFDEPEAEEASQAEGRFALEEDLQRYLARNLHKLEKGLAFWDTTQGTEFPVQGRRIDILAKDASGVPVIVELKVSRGHEKVIGQALHYRALVKKLLDVPRVRLMLVASDFTSELLLACTEVEDVTLWKYKLLMQIDPVTEGE